MDDDTSFIADNPGILRLVRQRGVIRHEVGSVLRFMVIAVAVSINSPRKPAAGALRRVLLHIVRKAVSVCCLHRQCFRTDPGIGYIRVGGIAEGNPGIGCPVRPVCNPALSHHIAVAVYFHLVQVEGNVRIVDRILHAAP